MVGRSGARIAMISYCGHLQRRCEYARDGACINETGCRNVGSWERAYHITQHITPRARARVPWIGQMPDPRYHRYCCLGGVDLAETLSPEQVAELLAAPCASTEAARLAAVQALPPGRRISLPGLALLHAFQATHGKGCALATLRPGALPNAERDDVMLQLYRKLAGDSISSDKHLVEKALHLQRRRAGGGSSPSPALRRYFASLSLVRRERLFDSPGGAEKLNVEVKDGLMALKRCPDMDVRGLHIGDVCLVQGLDPGSGNTQWFQARVTGFTFRCLMPPVHVEFVATQSGDSDPGLLPKPTDAVCRKKQLRPLPGAEVFEKARRSLTVCIG